MANKRKKIKNQNLDKKIFRNTASSTKKINITPMNTRGGTRL